MQAAVFPRFVNLKNPQPKLSLDLLGILIDLQRFKTLPKLKPQWLPRLYSVRVAAQPSASVISNVVFPFTFLLNLFRSNELTATQTFRRDILSIHRKGTSYATFMQWICGTHCFGDIICYICKHCKENDLFLSQMI